LREAVDLELEIPRVLLQHENGITLGSHVSLEVEEVLLELLGTLNNLRRQLGASLTLLIQRIGLGGLK
jgi:hypothetical protein